VLLDRKLPIAVLVGCFSGLKTKKVFAAGREVFKKSKFLVKFAKLLKSALKLWQKC
jgi:hypothetical protein